MKVFSDDKTINYINKTNFIRKTNSRTVLTGRSTAGNRITEDHDVSELVFPANETPAVILGMARCKCRSAIKRH